MAKKDDKLKAMQKTVKSVGKSGLANSAVVAKGKGKPVLTSVNAKRPKLKVATRKDFEGSAAQRAGQTFDQYEVVANKAYREKYNAKLGKQNAAIKSNAKKIYGK